MHNCAGDSPPDPKDLEGWRRVVTDGRLGRVPTEAAIAAMQDLGPLADPRVLNPLVLHVSEQIQHVLYACGVGSDLPNGGIDVMDEVHGQMVAAMHDPNSKDGLGLRGAFVFRVEKRLIDAIRRARKKQKREQPAEVGQPERKEEEFDPRQHLDEHLDVKRILDKALADVEDGKRKAFELHMDRVPLRSKRGRSIEKELGISAKTVGNWIDEIQEKLKSDPEAQQLLKSRKKDGAKT